ncbi:MAG: hypothetical protein ACLU3I_06760 [Acutalibacteraceae bacterium]
MPGKKKFYMIHNPIAYQVDLVIIGAYLIAMVMVGLVVVRRSKIWTTITLADAPSASGAHGDRLRHYHRRQRRPDGSRRRCLFQWLQSHYDGTTYLLGMFVFSAFAGISAVGTTFAVTSIPRSF